LSPEPVVSIPGIALIQIDGKPGRVGRVGRGPGPNTVVAAGQLRALRVLVHNHLERTEEEDPSQA
jgi:hypothetical protein